MGVGATPFFPTVSRRTPRAHTLGRSQSLVVGAAFSIFFYYWAINVALSSEVMQEMIDDVVVPEEEGLVVPAGH